MNKMKIIDEVLESCRFDENYELDDVIEKLEEFKKAQQQVKNNVGLGSVVCSDDFENGYNAFKNWQKVKVDRCVKNEFKSYLDKKFIDIGEWAATLTPFKNYWRFKRDK